MVISPSSAFVPTLVQLPGEVRPLIRARRLRTRLHLALLLHLLALIHLLLTPLVLPLLIHLLALLLALLGLPLLLHGALLLHELLVLALALLLASICANYAAGSYIARRPGSPAGRRMLTVAVAVKVMADPVEVG